MCILKACGLRMLVKEIKKHVRASLYVCELYAWLWFMA